eukprot:gene5986-4292_t
MVARSRGGSRAFLRNRCNSFTSRCFLLKTFSSRLFGIFTVLNITIVLCLFTFSVTIDNKCFIGRARTKDLLNAMSWDASATVPARGPRYIVSPSLPNTAQKMVASFRCQDEEYIRLETRGTTTLPQLQSTYMSGTLGSKGYTSPVPLDDPSFGDTLSRMGPAARKLLDLDDRQKTASLPATAPALRNKTKKRKIRLGTKNEGVPIPEPDVDMFADTLGSARGKAKKNTPERYTASLTGTLSRRSRTETNSILKDLPPSKSNVIRNPNEEPPLVKTLKKYLERELKLTCGACVPTSTEALGPYREALGALITAFPGYRTLLCDIQSAYDNVLQSQSELLAEAYAKEMANYQMAQKYQEDTSQLRSMVSKLESDLGNMQLEIVEREKKAARAAEQRHSAGSSRADNIELRKHLEIATVRVEELETMTKGDSEKILVLIGAVRECDKRLKAYEKKVAFMSGQVAELNEFQRLAGEAQAELQKYKHKFRAYVSAEDFELMKNYLTEELAAAQTLARHLRRTATVRGTQVDVMMRKIRQLEWEQKKLTDTDNPRGLLTPRPEWKKVYEQVPELGEYTTPIHNDSLAQISNPNKKQEEEVVDEAERLVVDGPKQSTLQVEFLVNMVTSLKEKLQRAEEEKNSAVEEARKDHISKSFRRISMAEPTPGTHPQSGGRQGSSKSLGSKRRSQVETVAPVMVSAPPIICPGVRATVPVHLRSIGVVERIAVNSLATLKIAYEFFRTELLPSLELQEPSAAAECDVQTMFLHYLEDKVMKNEEMGCFVSPPHLALNLVEDSKDPFLRTPALVLLINILQGVMPVRLAVDSIIVVSQVVDDLTAVAKEQQKSRLRRHAIAESLTPILELKTTDEISELRATLGHDASFDLYSLVSIENRFLSTMFYQQCQVSMDTYTKLIKALTLASTEIPDENYDRLITMEDLARVIYDVEPNTPEVIVQELTDNSTRRPDDTSGPIEEKLRLSDAITALDVAPIFLRTPQCTREECVL